VEEKSLIEYPSVFPIKVMGKANPEFLPAIVHIAQQFDPIFNQKLIEQRPSKDGNYLGLTLPINATSREQLEGQERKDYGCGQKDHRSG
jgi:putative lipoic acid-binding regulatory protein